MTSEVNKGTDEIDGILERHLKRMLSSKGEHLPFPTIQRHAYRRSRISEDGGDPHLASCFQCQSLVFRLEQEVFRPREHKRRVLEFLTSGCRSHREVVRDIGLLWENFSGPSVPVAADDDDDDDLFLQAAFIPENAVADTTTFDIQRSEVGLEVTAGPRSVRPAIVAYDDERNTAGIVLAPTVNIWDRVLDGRRPLLIPNENIPKYKTCFVGIGFTPTFPRRLFDLSADELLAMAAEAIEQSSSVDSVFVLDERRVDRD